MTTRCTIATVLLAVAVTATQAQPLTIDSCYALATKNYPLVKKQDLIARTSGYSLKNAGDCYLSATVVKLNTATKFPQAGLSQLETMWK